MCRSDASRRLDGQAVLADHLRSGAACASRTGVGCPRQPDERVNGADKTGRHASQVINITTVESLGLECALDRNLREIHH